MYFTVQNGVKQGGVFSPVLFAVYMDCLFKRLEERGVGCHMGNHFVGCLGYADSVAPSNSALQVMVNLCQGYANEFDVIFNGSKSSCCTISVNDEELQCTTTAIHLGHTINGDDKESIISAACY